VSALAPSIENEASTPAAIAAEIPQGLAAGIPAGLPRVDGASRGECTCPGDCVRDHPNE
jgi:hypothetical protein